jgi:cysteine dioxygenase
MEFFIYGFRQAIIPDGSANRIMSTTICTALEPLLEYLDGLQARPRLEELAKHVSRVEIRCEDVADFLRFSEKGYQRNLVKAGPWYNLLVLCWKNGQRSPIHDHKGSVCALRVLRGVLTETLFEFTPNGHVKALLSRDFGPGSVVASQDSDLHQVSNLQEGTADLVTLHAYAPALEFMGTYSLTDRTRGLEPMLMEFTASGGI